VPGRSKETNAGNGVRRKCAVVSVKEGVTNSFEEVLDTFPYNTFTIGI